MQSLNLEPTLTSHLDISASMLSYLRIQPPISDASTVFGGGVDLLTIDSASDVPADRLIICNGRLFPRKNKVHAFVTHTDKWWFRVTEFKDSKRWRQHMTFDMVLHTDLQDNLSMCDLAAFRRANAKKNKKNKKKHHHDDDDDGDENTRNYNVGRVDYYGNSTGIFAKTDNNLVKSSGLTVEACKGEEFWAHVRKFQEYFWTYGSLKP
eukprot:TRINITY_DN4438_c0_g1_i1.p1 TRINITY_DN4438_c0_g1~~TRINITY_DN4438_c0_g1_i1.p1  ORF type:complete len:233 (-),score=36.28 TRINITY_DN4438_c0_g1_i1:26-649(-)